MKQVHEDKMSQLAANAAREELKRHAPAVADSSDDEADDGVKKRKPKKPKKKTEEKPQERKPKKKEIEKEKKAVHADGVTPGSPVKFPGVESDAGKAFLTAHPPVDLPTKDGKSTRKVKCCWDFFHPQGCRRKECHFHHP